jgi:hypothetical protein
MTVTVRPARENHQLFSGLWKFEQGQEKEKQIQDAKKANDELKRKLEQGSQQAQGEVAELQLEELLRSTFPTDQIEPVPKGLNGAESSRG